MSSDEHEPAGADGGAIDEVAEGAHLESFPGLADLDEDLRTMHQNSTEVERGRRLSTRGLTPATGLERDAAPPGLAAPIVEAQVTTAEMDALSVATAPGTIAAPPEAVVVRRRDPDSTAQLRSVTPEVLAALGAPETRSTPSERAAARKSFAPPKDSPSAPPGSRVLLPSDASAALSAPRPSSRPPVFVPRPSQPPPSDEEQAELRGWRASDPSHAESDEVPAAVVIPPPARLPNMSGGSSSPPRGMPAAADASADASPPVAVVAVAPPARAVASDAIEIDARLVIGGVIVAVAAFVGLVYLVFL